MHLVPLRLAKLMTVQGFDDPALGDLTFVAFLQHAPKLGTQSRQLDDLLLHGPKMCFGDPDRHRCTDALARPPTALILGCVQYQIRACRMKASRRAASVP